MTNNEAAAMIRNDMKLHHDDLSGTYRKALRIAVNALGAEQPTADVVKVVRCKDCKYYTLKPQQTSRVTSVRRCNRSAIVCTKPDDFCSFGERIAK